ncbi:MAG: hypothetical protein WCJ29_01555 [bacterium]
MTELEKKKEELRQEYLRNLKALEDKANLIMDDFQKRIEEKNKKSEER